jgi:hypothetical protein
MILFLVGSGRLKLDPGDARSDTPTELKDLMVTCSHFDRDQRYTFVQVNDVLRKIKLPKQKKIIRAQSVPNVNFGSSLDSSNLFIGSSIYEDDIYPATPHLNDLSSYSNHANNYNFDEENEESSS